MTKTLCKWSEKKIWKKFIEYTSAVINARYVCTKCGRAANDKKVLCHAKQIETKRESK